MAVSPRNTAASNLKPGRTKHTKPTWRSIKVNRSLTIDEAAVLTGTSKGTIRRWIKSGSLPAITDKKPHLILGGDLADYLKGRSMKGPKLELDQFFCFRCRARRRAALKLADYMAQTATTGNLRALCECCETVMNKAIAVVSLKSLEGVLEVTLQPAREHLMDTVTPSLNDHLDVEIEADA